MVVFYFFFPENSKLEIASKRGNEVSEGDLTGGGCGERASERGRSLFYHRLKAGEERGCKGGHGKKWLVEEDKPKKCLYSVNVTML